MTTRPKEATKDSADPIGWTFLSLCMLSQLYWTQSCENLLQIAVVRKPNLAQIFKTAYIIFNSVYVVTRLDLSTCHESLLDFDALSILFAAQPMLLNYIESSGKIPSSSIKILSLR